MGNLKQEDFQIFDNGKPQVISRFSMEKAGAAAATTSAATPSKPTANPAEPEMAPTAVIPQRFVAYLFDDVHLKDSDIAQTRNAVKRQLRSMTATDRVAIYTTSGLTQIDFTDDRDKLFETLDKIQSHPLGKSAVTPCPNISYYMADLIQNKHDQRALVMATQDALDCAYLDDPNMYNQAKTMAETTALEELNRNDDETRMALNILNNLIGRTAAMPGERTIVLVSPGFINPDEISQQVSLMDRALKAKVVISTLDARGLYTQSIDISEERPPSQKVAGVYQEYRNDELAGDDDILAELAYTTGGTFYHGNDFDEGFRRVASPPEYSYLLGFTPQNLKLDGKYHRLKVSLKHSSGAVQARNGYFAPKGPADASEQAKQDIEDAVLSREEVRGIPIEVHTQFFKSDQADAKLSVVARVDVRQIHFRKDNGRNNNDITIVSALFDDNGNFVAGTEKVLQLHLKDETLEQRLGSGITLKSNFDVKPGSYLVRLVVRGEDGQLAAQNSSVEIP
jgi:VWFA-related protein